jgi:hypothetical protein
MIKPRNWLVPVMRLSTKSKAFVDKKKEHNKQLCRKVKFSLQRLD